MHGPNAPIHPWDDYPHVPYVDSVVLTLEGTARRRWKRARNRALRLWGASGLLSFYRVNPVAGAPEYDMNHPDKPRWVWDNPEHTSGHMEGDEDKFMRSLLVPGAMHLIPMPENWNGTSVWGAGWMFDTGSFAAFYVKRAMADNIRYGVTHEMGHALGLGHQRESLGGQPSSVMYMSTKGYRSGSERPDAHDIDSLRRYYNA